MALPSPCRFRWGQQLCKSAYITRGQAFLRRISVNSSDPTDACPRRVRNRVSAWGFISPGVLLRSTEEPCAWNPTPKTVRLDRVQPSRLICHCDTPQGLKPRSFFHSYVVGSSSMCPVGTTH